MARNSIMLGELLDGISSVAEDQLITGLCLDSRQVKPKNGFVAIAGEQADGRDYISQAVENGASVIIAEQVGFAVIDVKVPVILIEDLANQVSELASRFYSYPSKECRVIGVTGTNAKTSVCYLVAQAAVKLGVSTAMIGTIGYGDANNLQVSALTTPDAISVQRQLRELVDKGFDIVCMEVSSHGLAQYRVAAVEYEVVVFTNLSQDHLDYHGSMQAYAEAKGLLFAMKGVRKAVINADDEFGQVLIQRLPSISLTFGKNGTLAFRNVNSQSSGVNFQLVVDGQIQSFESPLVGDFNVINLTAVVGVLLALGFAIEDTVEALKTCHAPPGRLERIGVDQAKPCVVVDYAHTPDALEKALSVLVTHCNGVLSVVFGCGGDRDKDKRPLMGAIAERIADEVVLTDDNPRSETPSHIVTDILSGMKSVPTVTHDRSAAITLAIQRSKPEDWILIAGKGHETAQVYANHSLEVNDREIAISALEQWRGLAA